MRRISKNKFVTIMCCLLAMVGLACEPSGGVKRDKFDPPKGKFKRAEIHISSSDPKVWFRYIIQGSHKEEVEWNLHKLGKKARGGYTRIYDVAYAKDEKLLIRVWAEIDRGGSVTVDPGTQRWIQCEIVVEGKTVTTDTTRGVTALSQEIFCRART